MFVLLRFIILAGLVLVLISAVMVPLTQKIRAARSDRAPDDSPDFLAALDEEIKRRRGGRREPPPRTQDLDQSTIDDTIARFEEEFGKTDEPPAG